MVHNSQELEGSLFVSLFTSSVFCETLSVVAFLQSGPRRSMLTLSGFPLHLAQILSLYRPFSGLLLTVVPRWCLLSLCLSATVLLKSKKTRQRECPGTVKKNSGG